LRRPEDLGTNADGSRSEEYCPLCFRNGSFTEPDITMQQMIDRVVGVMARMRSVPEEQAREVAAHFIPMLKRWRTA